MTNDRFVHCLTNFTWRSENDGQPAHSVPGDLGGLTSWGMTYLEYCRVQKLNNTHVPTPKEFTSLSRNTFIPIYKTEFWDTVYGSGLPVGLDLMVFDMAVLSSPRQSIKILQKSFGIEADGVLGPQTKATIDDRGITLELSVFFTNQMDYFKTCVNYDVDGNGWKRRALDALTQAKLDHLQTTATS